MTSAALSTFEGMRRLPGSKDVDHLGSQAFCVEATNAEKDTFRSRRIKRHERIRKKLSGTPERPRLAVYRSNLHMYAQIIDDTKSHTLCSASTLVKDVIEETGGAGANKKAAFIVGKHVAQRALEKGITKVCFDRGGFMYHGRVKAVADGARNAGLEF